MSYPYSYTYQPQVEAHQRETHLLPIFLGLQFVFILLFITGYFLLNMILNKPKVLAIIPQETPPQVLGESSVVSPITTLPTDAPTPTQTPTPTLLPSPTPPQIFATPKSSYSIAVIGDSMVDTMGERLEYLEHALKKKYPATNFNLYNYGRGAETVEMGLGRFASPFNYMDRHYPAIAEVKPDIIIVASFAYNPFTPYDRDRHWLGLTKLIQDAQKITPQIYILAEITPLRFDFGKGPGGVNYETATAYKHSGWIVEQLENAIGLSQTLNLPLIDAYNPSKEDSGEGKRKYVNPNDGIHPSVEGHEFTADIITKIIRFE